MERALTTSQWFGEIILSKILITGFVRFLGEPINPTHIILDNLQAESPNIETLLLPVSFQHSWRLLETKLAGKEYDYVIMLGQAGGREQIEFERVALNWIETAHPDEDGVIPRLGKIGIGPDVHFTTLPILEVIHALKAQSIPARVSLSAGGYVCNYLYYNCLQYLANSSLKTKACFIHVPYLPTQIVGKSSKTPSMPLSTMLEAIKITVETLIKK